MHLRRGVGGTASALVVRQLGASGRVADVRQPPGLGHCTAQAVRHTIKINLNGTPQDYIDGDGMSCM
eukprot:COSAG05_NODE_1709_length_4237_cov_14.296762_3_plen_67_part_00